MTQPTAIIRPAHMDQPLECLYASLQGRFEKAPSTHVRQPHELGWTALNADEVRNLREGTISCQWDDEKFQEKLELPLGSISRNVIDVRLLGSSGSKVLSLILDDSDRALYDSRGRLLGKTHAFGADLVKDSWKKDDAHIGLVRFNGELPNVKKLLKTYAAWAPASVQLLAAKPITRDNYARRHRRSLAR